MGTIRDDVLAQAAGEAPAPLGAIRPTPPLALAGMDPRPVVWHHLRLGPMTLSHWKTLQALKNPIVTPGERMDTRALLEAAAVLAMAPRQAREAAAIDIQEAADDLGDCLPVGLLSGLAEAVTRCLEEGFETALPFERRDGGKHEKKASSDGSSNSCMPCWKPTGEA